MDRRALSERIRLEIAPNFGHVIHRRSTLEANWLERGDDLENNPMSEYSCLIVEDSPMMRQLLVFALARVKNLRVTEADDGVDGLRKLASARYDIIVTDINMPIMDGLKLVRRVRSDPTHKDTPIVIITTEGSLEDRQRALQLGANAYITKPIQAPQVIATVKELLKID